MKYLNSYIKYILFVCIAIIATACSNGSCDSNNSPDNQEEVILDSSDGNVANGATNVPLLPSIVLQFKQPMNALTVNSSTVTLTVATNSQQSKRVQDNQIIPIGQIVANNDSTKFYFSPISPLQPGTKYVVNLSGSIQTVRGTFITPVSFNFTTTTDSDNINPTVSIIQPGNGAIKVLRTPNIQVKFSEAVQNVNTTTVTLRQGSPTGSIVATGSIIAGANNVYTFSPINPLGENTTYYVVLTDGIIDIAGNPLTAKSFSFTTGDFNEPSVSMTTPSNGQESVLLTPTITLQFSEAVQNVSGDTVGLYQESSEGQRILITDIVAGADNTYTFSPSSPLNSNTTYYVVLTNAIKDAAVNSLAPTILSFTTGDFTAPTVQMTTPSNNAESVPLTPTITLQFSEAVQNVNTTTVTLRQGSDSGTVIATGNIVPGADNTYTFSPSSPLDESTTYYVVLTNVIKDMTGNELVPTNFSFTTGVKAWGNLGNPGFSAEIAQYQSLAIAPDGTTYVAYRDQGNDNKTTVMSFNHESWVTVGTAGFSAGIANYQSLAINESGTPYVAYRDLGNSNKTTVMMFNGTSWVPVGTVGFSAGNSNFQSLALTPNSTPYVAYQDFANGTKTTVMMFNGTNWVTVGTAGFSAGQASYQSLATNESGTPYVAYRDGGNGTKATVMMFNGTSWVTVGTAGFSAGQASYLSLAINKNGTPYVAYSDNSNGNKTTVMLFNGTSWVPVGTAGFSVGEANYQSLAINESGTPYVAYKDDTNINGVIGRTTVMNFQ